MQFLKNNNIKLAYDVLGDSRAPAILLIMGLGMSHGAWPDTFIARLIQEGFRIILFDNRDSGESTHLSRFGVEGTRVTKAIFRTVCRRPVKGPYSLEDMALDSERLLDHLGIRRAHVVGFSMGGMIAQVLACQCPNRVATLTSASSAVGNPSTGLGSPRAIWTLLRYPKGAHQSNSDEIAEYFRKVFLVLSSKKYRPTQKELDEMLQRLSLMKYDHNATTRQLMAILTSGDRSHALSQLRVPTLVMHGTMDPLLPFSAGQETAKLIQGAELVAWSGMGHQLPEVLSDQMARRIALHCHTHSA